ncbi:MAG TPA: hypothetical protein VK843_05635 [Planctomycetota bacterium]|nr:hypothetical protein [Planctomycetota bacterium]
MGALALVCCALASFQESAVRRASWNDFPVFVWRQDRGEEGLDPKLAQAFGATNLGRGEPAKPLTEAGLAFYVDNAAGRNELHLDRDRKYEKRWNEWYDKRDDALLIRQPCLNDPAVRERLRETLARTLDSHRADVGLLGLSLGDEVSWTPYGSPEDTCLCEHCQSAWRVFLERAAARGASRLAADFPLARASTDAARLALEQGTSEPVQAWLLRREFTQESMQERMRELSAQARSSASDIDLGLLGLIGRTAFGGVAIDRVLPALDFIECYRVSDARELLFSLRSREQRVVQTIFYDEQSSDAPTWFAWESWMRGADGLVIWSDRELRGHPDYAAALTRATARIRAVREREPLFAPRPRGVAIVNDEASIAYGWLVDARLDGPTWPKRLQGWQEDHGSRERSLRAWLRVLEDCGAMPGALPLERVGAVCAKEFPLLVINHLRVLDAEGAKRLLEYLGAGGILVIRGELGAIDRFGNPPEHPWIEKLREGRASQVILVGAELDNYVDERMRGGVALRERIAALLARAHTPGAAWRVVADGLPVPWLSTWCELADGNLLCASLPNLAEGKERQEVIESGGSSHPRLFQISARLEVGAEREVQWLNPPDARGLECKLPAGEAAVFRLVRK